MTELALTNNSSIEADFGDFDKARRLTRNLISNNADNPNNYIAAARIEELDGKLKSARLILQDGL